MPDFTIFKTGNILKDDLLRKSSFNKFRVLKIVIFRIFKKINSNEGIFRALRPFIRLEKTF